MRLLPGKRPSALKRFPGWLLETARWLWEAVWEGLHVWLPAVAFVSCVLVALVWPCPVERMVRLMGMVLQVLGAITIAPRLWAARRQFPGQWWKRWWQRRPRLKALHTVISAHGASLGFSSGTARGRVTVGPQAPLEQRVAMLEDNYGKLFDEVGGLGNQLQRRADELSARLQAEASAREAGDKRVEGRLRETAVGTLHFDLWGVLFFILGTIAGTASPEIANALGAFCR